MDMLLLTVTCHIVANIVRKITIQNNAQLGKAEEIQPDPVGCNCDGSHVSSSKLCPKREEFIKMQHYLNNKNWRNRGGIRTQHHQSTHHHQSTQHNLSTEHHQSTQQRNGAHQPVNNQRDYTPQNDSYPQLPPPKTRMSPLFQQYENETPNLSKTTNINNNKFLLAEITSLVNDVVNGLSNCKNRMEEFNVIMNLYCKYLKCQ